jgi:hypothetical protein
VRRAGGWSLQQRQLNRFTLWLLLLNHMHDVNKRKTMNKYAVSLSITRREAQRKVSGDEPWDHRIHSHSPLTTCQRWKWNHRGMEHESSRGQTCPARS